MSLIQRALAPIVELRTGERLTAVLMFSYSFLAMAGYNIVKPATRSQFINSLGADNLPYVQLAAGLIMGFVIQGYTSAMRLMPRRWVFAATQAVMVALLALFWTLFKTGQGWVSVAFYLWGVLAGSLLISQFWSLANDIYDARQAKRVFGFIGGGASLGGIVGAGFAGNYARSIGTNNLLLVAAGFLAVCFAVVWAISAREKPGQHGEVSDADEKGMGPREAIALLVSSKHFRLIALVISFAAIGAGIIEQQLNMAVEEAIPGKDARTAFLGNVIFYSSIAGFFIQMVLTSRIHRLLGIGFALLMMPVSIGGTALLMLAIPALWTSTTARVLDTALRYTVDKTTREILFMPLPTSMKYKAKPFADVAVDRFAKGVGAAVALIIAIKVFGLTWWQLSYLTAAVSALWVVLAVRAKREYLASFRQSIERRDLVPADVRLTGADLSTIETLVQELANPDADRVIYAIDVLESLDKRNLVTPLLLYHESPRVRARALGALADARTEIARKWAPNIRRLLADPDSVVRAKAIVALGAISNEDAATLARPMLDDPDPRIRATAAAALATSSKPGDLDLAEATLVNIIGDTSEATRRARRDIAGAIRQATEPRLRRLLIPLLYDPAPDVADEAMESVRTAGAGDFVFVPTLVALLRHRRLKGSARAVLVSYGEEVVDALAHFMRDPEEDIWVRRHIPQTLALIPTQKTVDVLATALEQPDGFLRYKAVSALERLRRTHESLKFPQASVEKLAVAEARHYFNYLSLYDNLFGRKQVPRGSLLGLALEQKMDRTKDRIFRLLALVYPWRDIGAAQWTLEHGDARGRASASEYLDNILTGLLRKRIMPVVEDLPLDEKVRRGNVLLKTRPRDVEETLLQLINDEDQVVAASAIDLARQEKIWALADDIEHVLAHRDARDWYVFEAASWALAEKRMPAERRRELWLEPLPAAELASRLRELPLFASVSVDELFRIASTARQVRHESGAVLLHEGAIPENTHLLLDGRVVGSSRTAAPHALQAPSALGFAEALTGAAMSETIRTDGVAVTLVMTADELRTLLADNTDLASGLFTTLSDYMEEATSLVHPTGAGAELEGLAASGLSPVEKVLALQRVPLFSRISADEMRQLAGITQTVAMQAGKPLFPDSAKPSLWVILSGEIALDGTAAGPGGVATARAGDFFGAIATMAGRSPGVSATVVSAGTALRLDREDLFALLGERAELLRQIFAGMFRSESARLMDTRI